MQSKAKRDLEDNSQWHPEGRSSQRSVASRGQKQSKVSGIQTLEAVKGQWYPDDRNDFQTGPVLHPDSNNSDI